MTKKEYHRLQSFLYRVGDKSAILIYLLSFLSPKAIRYLSANDLNNHLSGISEIDTIINNFILDTEDKEQPCFCFANGRVYSSKDIEKILHRSYGSQVLDYRGIGDFQRFIKNGAGQ